MCGRFVRVSSLERFTELFGASGHPQAKVSYNIAPGSQLLVARSSSNGGRELTTLKWGLVPAWSDEPKTPYSTINARAETVASKPSFRSAFRHRRCLISADGFYSGIRAPMGTSNPISSSYTRKRPLPSPASGSIGNGRAKFWKPARSS